VHPRFPGRFQAFQIVLSFWRCEGALSSGVFNMDGSVNEERFDVVVVGGGHAGCEAAWQVAFLSLFALELWSASDLV
jgi:hypothetical protein